MRAWEQPIAVQVRVYELVCLCMCVYRCVCGGGVCVAVVMAAGVSLYFEAAILVPGIGHTLENAPASSGHCA